MRSAYADNVAFYGKIMPRDDVLKDKATFIRSSLAQLGVQSQLHSSALINNGSPLAAADSNDKDEQKWLKDLAKELSLVLQGPGGADDDQNVNTSTFGDNTTFNAVSTSTWGAPIYEDGKSKQDAARGGGMMRTRQIVSLDEVWGAWNRARGVCESFVYPPCYMYILFCYFIHPLFLSGTFYF